MCTVVYIPNKAASYFASLRDENPARATAIAPVLNSENSVKYISPVDSLAGGTWVGLSEFGNVIILLNGAFEKQERKAFYRKSRGLVVSELLRAEIPLVDWELMDMEDIEPYTLIVYIDGKLFQLVWDGEKKTRMMLDESKPQIWSSSTLYDVDAKKYRAELFENWTMMEPPINKASVLNFFKTFTDSQNGFIMNRSEKVKTLSYTFIEINEKATANFDYYDFINFKHHHLRMECVINSILGSSNKCNFDILKTITDGVNVID